MIPALPGTPSRTPKCSLRPLPCSPLRWPMPTLDVVANPSARGMKADHSSMPGSLLPRTSLVLLPQQVSQALSLARPRSASLSFSGFVIFSPQADISCTDPSYECAYYSYAPVTALKSQFPTPWIESGADLVAGDTEAMALFQTINQTVNSKFPNIKPKGQTNGDFTGVGYNASDPDCWWTWHQCTTPPSATGLSPDITIVPEPLTWGLGFDDGPNCSHNALYDALQADQQKATMWVLHSLSFPAV